MPKCENLRKGRKRKGARGASLDLVPLLLFLEDLRRWLRLAVVLLVGVFFDDDFAGLASGGARRVPLAVGLE